MSHILSLAQPNAGKHDRRTPSAFHRRKPSIIRTTAAIVFAVSTCLTLAASPVAAQTFGADGSVFAKVECSLATHKASVTVYGLNPTAFSSTGLYYYVRIWAKERSMPATSYKLFADMQVGPINTSMTNGSVTWRDPIWLVKTSFYGSANYKYDVYVQYWFAAPGRSWSSMGGFRVQDDLGVFNSPLGAVSQSTIWTNGYQTPDCML